MKQNIFRTHHCEDIDASLVDQTVVVSGWIENIRDHGGVLFLDLRDNTDKLQAVSNDDSLFVGLAKESVVKLTGTIRKRSEDTVNNNLKTGEVELLVSDLEVLSASEHELPFQIISSKEANDDVRLKYRYLDMRNEKVKDNILLRSDVLHFFRNKMHDLAFTEVQTPILTVKSEKYDNLFDIRYTTLMRWAGDVTLAASFKRVSFSLFYKLIQIKQRIRNSILNFICRQWKLYLV